MIGRSRFCSSVACAVVMVTLIPAGSLMAQLNDTQTFDGTTGTVFAMPAGSVPYWSVDGGCSGAHVFQDGTRGDNGTKCLRSLFPGTGTRMIRDLNPGPGSSTIGEMKGNEIDTIRRLFVSADDGSGTNGQELYRLVDPLYPIMILEKDINPGPGSSGPADLYQHWPGGVNLYFSADDGTTGRELWLSSMSTGLSANTNLVMDINPGAGSSNPSGFVTGPWPGAPAPRIVLFAADDGTNGRELWKTDGTGPNTAMVSNINTNAGVGSDPQLLTAVYSSWSDVKVFFTADNGVNGRELWRSDGTPAGTGLLKDIVAGPTGSNPTNLTAGNPLVAGVATPTLFFTVDSDGVNGQELWMSRGALSGVDTVMLKDCGASPTNLTNVKGLNTLFFVVGNDLWRSRLGTTAGTVLVKTFASPPTNLAASEAGGTSLLYFAADDGTGSGVELWKADTTGTALVKDINPGAGSSSPTNLFAMGGTLYFSADDGTIGRELWRTDTTADALLIEDINPGAASSNPSNMANFQIPTSQATFDSLLVFTADDGTHGRELWQSDGFADPNRAGMSYKWDLASLIQSKGDASRLAVAGTNANPLSIYWLFDFPAMGGTTGVSEAAHQVNTYVELTDGTDRAPLTITNVDCGDGNLTRPKAALTDNSSHNAIAFGMVAVLDQDPCDTDSRGGGSPSVPFAHVPAVYDGHDWIPMDMVHFSPGIPTDPPSAASLAQGPFAYLTRNSTLPDNLSAATTDPWASKRFAHARVDVFDDYFRVIWASNYTNTLWVATVPRQYKGGFKSLYFGNSACVQPVYPFYLDTLQLNGGVFACCTEPYGACCEAAGSSCTDVQTANQCPSGRFKAWKLCGEPKVCCPTPFADADFDGDVDHTDFGLFQACYTGNGGGVPAGCECFNRDNDSDVDAADFTAFDNCFTGANVLWSQSLKPSCTP